MDTPEKKEEVRESQKYTQRPDVLTLQKMNYTYANSTYVFSSNWDIRFVFGERIPLTPPGSQEPSLTITEPRVGIVMSFQQAKSFHEAFSRIIESVETMLGKINFKPLDQKEEP